MRSLLVPALLLLAIAGCQSATTPEVKPSKIPEANLKKGWRDFHHQGVRGSEYELLADTTIDGKVINKGLFVAGERDEAGRWLIPPEYFTLVGDGPLAFGQRYSSDMWVRLDIGDEKSPHAAVEQPTKYTDIVCRRKLGKYANRSDENDRWFGIEGDTGRVGLLDENGRTVCVLENLVSTDLYEAIQALPGERATLVHYNGFDRIYNRHGQPISPDVHPLWSASYYFKPKDRPAETLDVFGVCLDPAKSRYWLLLNDGTVNAKPDDCLGLQPLTGKEGPYEYVRGWLVWWKTPAGERAAFVDGTDPVRDFSTVMMSRPQAKWIDWATELVTAGVWIDYRQPDGGRYEILWGGDPGSDRTFDDLASAKKWLADTQHAAMVNAQKKAQEQEEARKRGIELAIKYRQEALVRQREPAAKELAEAIEDFDAGMRLKDQKMARAAVLKIPKDRARWTQYVTAYGLDPNAANNFDCVGYARAKFGGTDDAALEKAVKDAELKAIAAYRVAHPEPIKPAQPTSTYQPPQSDWDYFWHGPRDGNYVPLQSSYQADPRLSVQGVHDALEAQRRANEAAWTRGAQNWGLRTDKH